MEPSLVALGAIWFVAFLFSTTLHEGAHALAAFRLGDPTAYHGGQVTLNPLPHVRREPFGMVLVPIVSFALSGWMFGWASAPYDPLWAARHPRRAAWMALAGPAANLLLVLLAGVSLRIGLASGLFTRPLQPGFASLVAAEGSIAAGAAALFSVMFTLNLILFLFNLLPFPPLDGSAAIQLLMPEELARRYQEFLRQPIIALAGILLAWRIFGPLFGPVIGWAVAVIYA